MADVRDRVESTIKSGVQEAQDIADRLQHQLKDAYESITNIKQTRRQYLTIGLAAGVLVGLLVGLIVGFMNSQNETTQRPPSMPY